MKQAVILTDGQYKHTLAAARSLSRRYRVVCGAPRPFAVSFFSNCVGSKFLYPSPGSDPKGFVATLESTANEAKCSAVVPVGYEACLSLTRLHPGYSKVMLPEREAMEIAADKLRTMDFAKGAGIPVPETMQATGWQGVVDASERFGSFFLKATQGSGQNRLVRRFNPEDPGIPRKFLSGDVKAIAQRIVRGDGYGFFGLFNRGKPRALFMHRRVREAGPDGGASTCAESVWDEDLRRNGLALFGALGWHGVAMAEFKKDLDGKFRLLEINPKFWGSLDLAIASGVDFPSLLVRCITEGDCEEVTTYRVGTRFQWPFPDDFSRVAWQPTALGESMSELFSTTTKKNLKLTDPLPTFVQGCQLFLPAIRGALRR